MKGGPKSSHRPFLHRALQFSSDLFHTCQHLEIRNQGIFTILAKRAPKAQAAFVQVFPRGCGGMLPRKIFEFSLSRMAENAQNLSTLIKIST